MTEPNNRPDWGPLASRVEELALSKSEENRAIGINLMYDHRISEARIAHFQESVKASVFAGVNAEEREQALLNALVQYRTQKVARLPNETFADRASNSRNQISADPKTLVHVCNVSQKLFRIATSGRRLGAEVTQAIDRLGTGLIALGRLDRVDAFLRATLRDPETKYEFVVNFDQAVGLKLLSGPLRGSGHVLKLRAFADTALRPLLCRGPQAPFQEYTLLQGAVERDWKLEPASALDRAIENHKLVKEDERLRTKHERP